MPRAAPTACMHPPLNRAAQVVDHYENPRNVGSFNAKDASVGTGLVGAPACGDVMKLQIKVGEGRGEKRGREIEVWLREAEGFTTV